MKFYDIDIEFVFGKHSGKTLSLQARERFLHSCHCENIE
jgi:hypothetical protein